MILKSKILVLIIFLIFNNYFTQDYHQRDLITYDTSTLTFLKKNLQPEALLILRVLSRISYVAK